MRSLWSWPGLIRSFVSNVRLSIRLVREPRVSLAAKSVLLVVAIYLVSPLDFIPDVLPIVGQIDDLAVALLALQFFLHLCPPTAVAFHRDAIAQGHRYSRMPAGGEIIEAEWKRED